MADSAPLLSVLIVTFNRMDVVTRCLESLENEVRGLDAEILVVDNCSGDGTPEMISRDYPEIRLFRWEKNLGLGPALFFLSRAARGEWLLILDSDAILQPGSLKGLLDFARSRPGLGAVAPRMRDPDGQVQLTARRLPTPVNALFGRQTLLAALWPDNPITTRYIMAAEQEKGVPFQCDWVAFAAALVRREAASDCGYVDPEFFVYWIDADFFRRLKEAGWEVWCCPSAEVLHLEYNRRGRAQSPVAIKSFHDGALRYFHKACSGQGPMLMLARLGLRARARVHDLINKRRAGR